MCGMTRHLGDVLRDLREAVGLSKNRLARRSGVSLSLISRIEGHHHHTMTPDNLALIAQALGTTVEDIWQRVGSNDDHPSNDYSLEEWLRRDSQLTEGQRQIVLAVYRGLAHPERG